MDQNNPNDPTQPQSQPQDQVPNVSVGGDGSVVSDSTPGSLSSFADIGQAVGSAVSTPPLEPAPAAPSIEVPTTPSAPSWSSSSISQPASDIGPAPAEPSLTGQSSEPSALGQNSTTPVTDIGSGSAPDWSAFGSSSDVTSQTPSSTMGPAENGNLGTEANTSSLGFGSAPAEPGPAPVSMENGPTDLSHLMGETNDGSAASATPLPSSSPETLVSSTVPATEAAQVVTSNSHSFPKWILIAGTILILLVAGGSAYFILGMGRPSESTKTTPGGQVNTTTSRSVLPPVASPTPSTSSATFGNLQGGNASLVTPTRTATTSSALELLRLRQGR